MKRDICQQGRQEKFGEALPCGACRMENGKRKMENGEWGLWGWWWGFSWVLDLAFTCFFTVMRRMYNT